MKQKFGNIEFDTTQISPMDFATKHLTISDSMFSMPNRATMFSSIFFYLSISGGNDLFLDNGQVDFNKISKTIERQCDGTSKDEIVELGNMKFYHVLNLDQYTKISQKVLALQESVIDLVIENKEVLARNLDHTKFGNLLNDKNALMDVKQLASIDSGFSNSRKSLMDKIYEARIRHPDARLPDDWDVALNEYFTYLLDSLSLESDIDEPYVKKFAEKITLYRETLCESYKHPEAFEDEPAPDVNISILDDGNTAHLSCLHDQELTNAQRTIKEILLRNQFGLWNKKQAMLSILFDIDSKGLFDNGDIGFLPNNPPPRRGVVVPSHIRCSNLDDPEYRLSYAIHYKLAEFYRSTINDDLTVDEDIHDICNAQVYPLVVSNRIDKQELLKSVDKIIKSHSSDETLAGAIISHKRHFPDWQIDESWRHEILTFVNYLIGELKALKKDGNTEGCDVKKAIIVLNIIRTKIA